ncbi:DgyrCDS11621 [Dimorphilus gyrociliatus]|uniref:DgyrCDS11621 n=1 Tax=Dimorphilus gyrociliatus TaxID=2664684 RepID=A0A7I8W3W5_9ANNE|nr:DgyrCDS11621 [Dimorphilus gyrociliatus]
MHKLELDNIPKVNYKCWECFSGSSEFDSNEHAFLGGDPSTRTGRHTQKRQIRILPQVPVVCCGIFTFVMLSLAVKALVTSNLMNRRVDRTEKLVNVVFFLRRERHQVLEYITTDGTGLTRTMGEVYSDTDKSINEISFYERQETLKKKLKDHRESTKLERRFIPEELEFYTKISKDLLSYSITKLINDGKTKSWNTITSWIWLFRTEESLDICDSIAYIKFKNKLFTRQLFYTFIENDLLAKEDLDMAFNYDGKSREMYENLYLKNSLLKLKVEDLLNQVKTIDDNSTDDLSLYWAKWFGYYKQIITDIRLEALRRKKTNLNEIYKTAAIESSIHLILLAIIVICIGPLLNISSKRTVISMHSLTVSISKNQRELKSQKRKTEVLLREMLPRSVAYKFLKGEEVEPQFFDCVTVLFSDIADFNQITSRSAPLQIVEFLNVIYNLIDDCVSKFDVYKVETIGAVYMVVSGLPMANGNKHAVEISKLALAMLRKTGDMDMEVINDKKLLLRIGIHTGSCVAGIVGNKMPRYCLFGDTINTASRMQTNGLPRKIHMSKTTKEKLDLQNDEWITEERGTIEIKGKGQMKTFWLIGRLRNQKLSLPESETSGIENTNE